MDMVENYNITIVAISDIKLNETIKALIKSSIGIHPAKTILFTSKNVKLNKFQESIINLIKIAPINSLRDYSNFVIYSLFKYLETSHTLIVQWDGYICNKEKWNHNFLNFDYIGAPFIPRYSDKKYCRDAFNAFYSIGNGGFSLRSTKLLEAPSKYKLKDNKLYTNFHEDGFFSVYHRYFLESKGFIWAPHFLAEEFSIETPLSLKNIFDLPFGFHGKKMLYFIKIAKVLIFIFTFFKKFSTRE